MVSRRKDWVIQISLANRQTPAEGTQGPSESSIHEFGLSSVNSSCSRILSQGKQHGHGPQHVDYANQEESTLSSSNSHEPAKPEEQKLDTTKHALKDWNPQTWPANQKVHYFDCKGSSNNFEKIRTPTPCFVTCPSNNDVHGEGAPSGTEKKFGIAKCQANSLKLIRLDTGHSKYL